MTTIAFPGTVGTLDRAWAQRTAPRLRAGLQAAAGVTALLDEVTVSHNAVVRGRDAEIRRLLQRARDLRGTDRSAWSAQNALDVAADVLRDVAAMCQLLPVAHRERLLKTARSLERTSTNLAAWHEDRPAALLLALAQALTADDDDAPAARSAVA